MHPEQAKKHAAPSRRRGSVINMHAFASALETVVSDSYDVLLTLDLGGLEIGCEGALRRPWSVRLVAALTWRCSMRHVPVLYRLP